jgi:hypothetical protein
VPAARRASSLRGSLMETPRLLTVFGQRAFGPRSCVIGTVKTGLRAKRG